MKTLLETNENGLYCAAGDFYVDPWQPVPRAVITHAHSDHARPGCGAYLTTPSGAHLLRARLGPNTPLQTAEFGERIDMNGVSVSLHPAGHILGSAQVRIEHGGEVWVVSGDYKIERDATCEPFAPVRCNTFLTESTFALPIYRWRPHTEVIAEIEGWWRTSRQRQQTCILFAYSLGKAQRILGSVDTSFGPILVHGALVRSIEAYRAAGVRLPAVQHADDENAKTTRGRALVLAPPSVSAAPWLRKFGDISTAFASGWMQIRGTRRRRALDRGFALSDHADWDGLLKTVTATGAENIGVTHGYTGVLVRWLKEQGKNAWALSTRYEGELENEKEE